MARNPHAASNVNEKDERQHRFTPRKLISWLHEAWRFTMDACGHPLSPASQIIGRGYTLVDPGKVLVKGDCYSRPWSGERVWLQPDFSELEEAVTGAVNAIAAPKPAELVVLLMPWNRQEQPLWQKWIEPFRDGKGELTKGVKVHTQALAGRVKFGTPDDPEGVKKHQKMVKGKPVFDENGEPVMLPNAPGFGCGLVIWQRN